MKKILSVILTVLLIVSIVPAFQFSVSAATNGYYTYTVTNGKATITDVDIIISGDVKIPKTLGGCDVKSIADHAFYECTRLTGVTLPDGVTDIGKAAFGFCQSLTSVNLPSTVTTIDDGAFSDCSRLEEVNIPNGVITIGNYAFSNCDRLTEIVIPDSVTALGEYAFGWCGKLKSILLGNGISAIADGTFFECQTLKNVKLGNNISTIGDFAFYSTELIDIVIPDKTLSIGKSAFENCGNLIQITLPETIINIESYAFYECNSLNIVWYGGSESNHINIGSFNESLTQATWHYGMCHQDEHIYSVNCLLGCTVCGWKPDAHNYTNACDTGCNKCDATRSVKSHTYEKCYEGYTQNLYGSWDISVRTTGVYTFKPNSKYTGVFNIHNIAVFDKNGYEVKFNESNGGFPLVAELNYVIKFKYDCSDEISGTIAWTRTRKADTIFSDVSASQWYNNAVIYAVGRGIISGYGGTTKFGPGDNIQRQDFMVILAKLDGVDLTQYGNKKSAFSDVPEGSYFEAAVNWGAEKGIVNGYANGKFGTGDKITREQLVKFLFNYANYKGIDTSYKPSTKTETKKNFTDYNQISSWALDSVLWAKEKGIISGKTATTLVPAGNALRCEVAQIMYNLFLNETFE